MPTTKPQESGVYHYWRGAPAPCERVGEVAGYGLTGVAAVGATVGGVAIAVSQTPPISILRQPIGGVILGCSLVASFGYHAARFTGKAFDCTIGAAAVGYNMAMYRHFGAEDREKIFAAQIHLNRYLLVLPEDQLRKAFLTIMYKYHNRSYCPSDASKALVKQLQDETSYQTKLRHVLAYSWDESNMGRNLFNTVCEELMALHQRINQQHGDNTLEAALNQRVFAPTGQDDDEQATTTGLKCPMTGRPMTLPVQIEPAKPYNGDGRAYDLPWLIEYKRQNGEAKLLGQHGEHMQIDFDHLQVDRDAYLRLQAFYEQQSLLSPGVSLTLGQAQAQARVDEQARQAAAAKSGSRTASGGLRSWLPRCMRP